MSTKKRSGSTCPEVKKYYDEYKEKYEQIRRDTQAQILREETIENLRQVIEELMKHVDDQDEEK